MTEPQQLVQRKAALRTQLLGRRAGIPEPHRARAAKAVAALLEEALTPGRDAIVSGYWPLKGELDPRPALDRLANRGHALALPRMDGPDRPLRFHGWQPGDALIAGAFGVMEPHAAQPQLIPDVVLVPLLAFDRRGGRLGYGKGYYDRTLAGLRAGARQPQAIGLAFAEQEVDEVPAGPDDMALDAVVTEGGLLRFADRGRGA